MSKKKEGNVLFNDALNTLLLMVIWRRLVIKDHSDSERVNYMSYSFRLAERVLL